MKISWRNSFWKFLDIVESLIRWTSLSYAFLFLYLWVYISKSNPLVCHFVSVDLDFVFCCCCLCVCVEMHSSRRHFNNLSYFPVGYKNSEWSFQGGLLNLGFKLTGQVFSLLKKRSIVPVAFGNVVVCLVISQIRDVANVGHKSCILIMIPTSK